MKTLLLIALLLCPPPLHAARCAGKFPCKVCKFGGRAGGKYVLETSANLRSCQNLEHASLTRSRKLFDFHAAWIARVAAAQGREIAGRDLF